MGYRTYLGIIDKEKLNELRNKTYVDTYYEDGSLDEFKERVQFEEIMDNCDYVYVVGETDKEINDELCKTREDLVVEGYKMFICSQNAFKDLANLYLQKTKRYFQKLIKPFEKDGGFKIGKELNDEQVMILKKILNNIDEKIILLSGEHFNGKTKDIEISWLYEYCAFNLAHIHKMIDFEKQVVICFAW